MTYFTNFPKEDIQGLFTSFHLLLQIYFIFYFVFQLVRKVFILIFENATRLHFKHEKVMILKNKEWGVIEENGIKIFTYLKQGGRVLFTIFIC